MKYGSVTTIEEMYRLFINVFTVYVSQTVDELIEKAVPSSIRHDTTLNISEPLGMLNRLSLAYPIKRISFKFVIYGNVSMQYYNL